MADLNEEFTLANAGTNYRASDLVTAKLGIGQTVSFCALHVVADKDNTDEVLVGGVNLSATNCVERLRPRETYHENDGAGQDKIHLTGLYLRSATAGQKVRIRGRVS